MCRVSFILLLEYAFVARNLVQSVSDSNDGTSFHPSHPWECDIERMDTCSGTRFAETC